VALAGTLLLVRPWQDSSAGDVVTTTAAPPSPQAQPRPRVQRIGRASIKASASSTHPDTRSSTYGIRNTLDGKLATAWNHNGPVRGAGVGETLTYRFRRPVRLMRVDIVNGYAKSPTSFQENGRIRQVTIISDGLQANLTLKDAVARQRLWEEFGVTTTVTVRVRSVYPGTRYDDLAVSEIAFFGTPAD
jgi:hypothetical protein